jgi:hypothetical protein
VVSFLAGPTDSLAKILAVDPCRVCNEMPQKVGSCSRDGLTELGRADFSYA